jgi:hypothetical protein
VHSAALGHQPVRDRKADAQWLKQNLPYFAKIAHEAQ